MQNWHDYHLTGHAVDGVKRRISLSVSLDEALPPAPRQAELVFSEVVGYFFEHDLGINILFSIEEVPMRPFLTANAAWFEKEKNWGWPLFWKETVDSTLTHLGEQKVRCFEISTSYGLDGWILARGYESITSAAASS